MAQAFPKAALIGESRVEYVPCDTDFESRNDPA